MEITKSNKGTEKILYNGLCIFQILENSTLYREMLKTSSLI